MINTINKDFLRRVIVVGAFSVTLPFLAISNSFGDGHIYGPNPITLKGYKGSKTDSTAYTGQIARQLMHNSLKKIVSKGNPSDPTGGPGKKNVKILWLADLKDLCGQAFQCFIEVW